MRAFGAGVRVLLRVYHMRVPAASLQVLLGGHVLLAGALWKMLRRAFGPAQPGKVQALSAVAEPGEAPPGSSKPRSHKKLVTLAWTVLNTWRSSGFPRCFWCSSTKVVVPKPTARHTIELAACMVSRDLTHRPSGGAHPRRAADSRSGRARAVEGQVHEPYLCKPYMCPACHLQDAKRLGLQQHDAARRLPCSRGQKDQSLLCQEAVQKVRRFCRLTLMGSGLSC